MGTTRGQRVAAYAGIVAVACFAMGSAQAAQITGSAGSVILTGNDPGNPSGSFRIQVDYSVYDGADGADPLGLTADRQVVFQLTHLGSDGEAPALDVGRFTVFAPDINNPVPYYTSISSLDQGGTKAPSLMDIDPPPATPNRGEFFFEDMLAQADFADGEVSHLLVLTTTPPGLPADVVIEINHTDTNPSIDADTTITLFPEPSALVLLALGGAVALRRRGL